MRSQFEIWLAKATNSFLNFWSQKVNRTTVTTLTGLTNAETLIDFKIPKGTWSFELRNTGSGEIIILFQTGATIEIRGQVGATSPLHDNVMFPGEPYVERDDVFKEIIMANADSKLEIICHRIIKRES